MPRDAPDAHAHQLPEAPPPPKLPPPPEKLPRSLELPLLLQPPPNAIAPTDTRLRRTTGLATVRQRYNRRAFFPYWNAPEISRWQLHPDRKMTGVTNVSAIANWFQAFVFRPWVVRKHCPPDATLVCIDPFSRYELVVEDPRAPGKARGRAAAQRIG
jgi:hypothetical protein